MRGNFPKGSKYIFKGTIVKICIIVTFVDDRAMSNGTKSKVQLTSIHLIIMFPIMIKMIFQCSEGRVFQLMVLGKINSSMGKRV